MLTTTLLLLLLLCVLVQTGYALYYFYPLAKYTPPALPARQEPVSVVVCAHNEWGNLRVLLPALLTQRHPAFEVILVDDRSTDQTPALLRDLQTIYPQLRLVRVTETPAGVNPKKFGLTQGIRAARYAYILLTDADCKPLTDNWISAMQRGFATGADIVLGYSPYRKTHGFLNDLIRYETLLTAVQYLSFALKGHAYMAVGRNVAYTKKCFDQNQGFASHLTVMGGDDDLFVRDAQRHSIATIATSRDARISSRPKSTYRAWFIQKRRHLSVGRQYTLADQVRIGSFMLANVIFYLILPVTLVLGQNLAPLGILFLVRSIVLYTAYVRIARKLGEALPVWRLPVLDAAYFLHYLFLGVSVLMFKKVRWK